jgi:TetR/AcrR family transcriptional regulator, repressor for neighboring sulfatase
MARAPRVRRSPEEARRTILDAALRLFASAGPDAVGLKEVAKEAGVSHALVTHYFGTYDGLVEAAFADHTQRVRAETIARIAELSSGGPRAWIEHASKQLNHPLYGRLVAWALLSGRMNQDDFFPRRDQGFRKVADVIEMRLAFDGKAKARDDIEFLLMLVLTALVGYTIGGRALWAGLGKDATPERDVWFRERLSSAVEALSGLGGDAPKTTAKRKRRS